jgi:transcription elongation GreA/GreB family factor
MESSSGTKIDQLRAELVTLRKEREKVTIEKGLIAQDNKDLRENAAYDYWEQKERNITSRIHKIIQEIEERSKS